VEVAVPHLTLAAPECYERLGAYAQMNPPIREARHREALWRGIADGTIDTVASDHAPHTRADKDGIYPHTASGLTGVQTLVTIMLDHVNAGRLSLERFVDLASAGPARVFGIAGKGRIAQGYDADFTIVDLGRRAHIENRIIASRCGWTPYDGMETVGWPVATILRGRIVMRDGVVVGDAGGQKLRFLETLDASAA
jgi:dihydroorotase